MSEPERLVIFALTLSEVGEPKWSDKPVSRMFDIRHGSGWMSGHQRERPTNTVDRHYNRALHLPGKGIHPTPESAPGTAVGRCAHGPTFAAQSAVQPKGIIACSPFRLPSLPVHARTGWLSARPPGLSQYQLA